MKIDLPRSRFHLKSTPHSCKIPTKALEGGGLPDPLRASPHKNVYLVIGKDGFPVKEKGEYKKYEAQKPYQAAIKAYYGLLRSKKPVQSTEPAQSEVQRIINVLSASISPPEMALYEAKLKSARIELPALIHLRRTDDSKVRSYVCFYELIEHPNKHEMSKGIVKVAKAEELSKYKQKRNLSDQNPITVLSY
jgi:hypothetical protein